MNRSLAAVAVVLTLGILPQRAIGDDPPPAGPSIRARLAHPDRQLRELIALFRGSKAEHPAAALAAWKRASAEPTRLGKPLEAVIAALNPSMVAELRTLDDAQIAFRFDQEASRTAWRAFLPHDDGTFAALASALALSGGAAEGPMGEIPVDRLGPPGSPLMGRGPGALLIAPDRAGLALAGRDAARVPVPTAAHGISVLAEPGALGEWKAAKSLTARRVGEAFGGAQASPRIEASATLGDATFSASLLATFDRPVASGATVEAGWLDWTPRDRASVAFALAIEPGGAGWDSAFALLDRFDRADPARAGVAPSRLRLGLAARAAGVRLEADLIPHLKGVSGWLALGGPKGKDAGLVALHLDDEAVAARVTERARPAEAAGKRPAYDLAREGSTLLIAWGPSALEDARKARSAPDRSAWPTSEPPSAFVASIWPGRLPGLAPEGSPLALSLLEARPISGFGTWQGTNAIRFEARWPALDGLVRRFLDRIPLNPPPDR